MPDFLRSDEQRSPAYKSPDAQISQRPSLGEIRMNNDLIPTIAAYAAADTRGIVSVTGRRASREFTTRKEAEKGVTVQVENGNVSVSIEVDIEFGYSVYETCIRCQAQVKNAIEHMSGFRVEKVSITVRAVVPQLTPPPPNPPSSDGFTPIIT